MVAGACVSGADGATARLDAWFDLRAAQDVDTLIALAAPPQRLGIIAVRRGGYAVACTDGAQVMASKVGRRHIHSRTAAGGWSQQRYARRRQNQAQDLIGAVADHAVKILREGSVDGVVRGGDRRLVSSVLDERQLAWLARLPSRDLYDLPDPSPSVLRTAIRRARSVRIDVAETSAGAHP